MAAACSANFFDFSLKDGEIVLAQSAADSNHDCDQIFNCGSFLGGFPHSELEKHPHDVFK